MIKNLILLVFLMQIVLSNAQFGISGGISVLKGFTTPKPFVGLHIGGEFPRDDRISFYGRFSFFGKQTEQNNTSLQLFDTVTFASANINFRNSMNYLILEGGNRYYIGNGYDSGFGAYGGGTFMLVFNTVKRKYDYGNVDQSKFPLPSTEFEKGSIFNIAVGLGGGLKHTFAGVGTIYLDASLAYMIMSTGSNTTAESVAGTLYSPLIFSFGLGFRKDLY